MLTRIGTSAILSVFAPALLWAQDSARTRADSARRLLRVDVRAAIAQPPVRTARAVEQGMLTTGARSEVVSLDAVNTARSEKTGRQLFARVPGVQVYDMDGPGNQLNISTRGLDPHRSWELNVRQDGIPLNSDSYGYPASHYSPPLEAIESLTLVRGTAALQYGAQLGGVVQYVTRGPDTTRAIAYRSSHTMGSFAQRSTFHSVGGRVGQFDWLAYGAARTSNGYRDVEQTRSLAALLRLDWRATSQLRVRAQAGFSGYRYRIPGPLTDAQFAADPTQASRTRNFYSPEITIPSLSMEWMPRAGTEVRAQLSGVYGARNSVQFIGFATVRDSTLANGQPANRQVDIDNFNSNTAEVRVLQSWRAAGREHRAAIGVALVSNHMRRRQQGVGTPGNDWDLSLVRDDFRRNVTYRTANVALFAEQAVAITSQWSVVPGVRVELGETRLRGRLAYFDSLALQRNLPHRFPLVGVRTEYRVGPTLTWYGGASQSYRPQLLKDALPDSPLERVDAGLRDIRGWNVEAGMRGSLASSGVTFDAGVFRLTSDGRFGVVARADPVGSTLLYKTSLGATETNGIEVRADVSLYRRATAQVTYFTGSSYMHARYRNGSTIDGGENVPLRGRTLEGVPTWIVRQGLEVNKGRWSATLQSSYTSSSYADPLNTRTPSATGARGLVPSYHVVDLNGMWRVHRTLQLSAGINNLFDTQYFTKRPTIYPGPGVWPSNGRSMRMTVEFTP